MRTGAVAGAGGWARGTAQRVPGSPWMGPGRQGRGRSRGPGRSLWAGDALGESHWPRAGPPVQTGCWAGGAWSVLPGALPWGVRDGIPRLHPRHPRLQAALPNPVGSGQEGKCPTGSDPAWLCPRVGGAPGRLSGRPLSAWAPPALHPLPPRQARARGQGPDVRCVQAGGGLGSPWRPAWRRRTVLRGSRGPAHPPAPPGPAPQDPLSSLEQELALQLQIAEASRRLSREEKLSRQARRQRKHAVLREEEKLRALERCLGEQRRHRGSLPAAALPLGRGASSVSR